MKARIIQQNGGEIESIYSKDSQGSYRFNKNGEYLTISLDEALDFANPSQKIKDNIKGLAIVRNQIVHLGAFATDLRMTILEYGTASIQNFIKILKAWFDIELAIQLFLPVGVIGSIEMFRSSSIGKQRDLLLKLNEIASKSDSQSEFSVALRIDVNLDTNLTGGATIGQTTDPNAPLVRIDDRAILKRYPSTHAEIVARCKAQYSDFIQNAKFNGIMKLIKNDPVCAHERELDPDNPKSQKKWFYNWKEAKKYFDREYKSRIKL